MTKASSFIFFVWDDEAQQVLCEDDGENEWCVELPVADDAAHAVISVVVRVYCRYLLLVGVNKYTFHTYGVLRVAGRWAGRLHPLKPRDEASPDPVCVGRDSHFVNRPLLP